MFAIEMAHKCSIWSLKFYFFFYIYIWFIFFWVFFFYILFYMFIFLYFSSWMPREGKSHRKKRVEWKFLNDQILTINNYDFGIF
jgi:hypothetical protein